MTDEEDDVFARALRSLAPGSFIAAVGFARAIFGLDAAVSWRTETGRFSRVSAAQTPAMAVRDGLLYPGPALVSRSLFSSFYPSSNRMICMTSQRGLRLQGSDSWLKSTSLLAAAGPHARHAVNRRVESATARGSIMALRPGDWLFWWEGCANNNEAGEKNAKSKLKAWVRQSYLRRQCSLLLLSPTSE